MNLDVVSKTVLALLDSEQSEAALAADFSDHSEWWYDDGVEHSRREAQRRFGKNTTTKMCAHERVRGPHTTIDFSGSYPAVTNEFKFIARHNPARALREIEAYRRIIAEYPGAAALLATIWAQGESP